MELPTPAKYAPWAKGEYTVAPGLRRLGTDYGNGEQDLLVFQIDTDFPKYQSSKRESRAEDLSKYYARNREAETAEAAAVAMMVGRLPAEHVGLFRRVGRELECRLTGEHLVFDKDWKLVRAMRARGLEPSYATAFDAVMSQIQADAALCQIDEQGRDKLVSLHVCNPSHWAPNEKLGFSFRQMHAPVPHFEKVDAVAPAMVDAMINKGPFVRFVWGVESDDRLNHHERPPLGKDPYAWTGRQWDRLGEIDLWIRCERQVLYPLPDANSSLFVIHPRVMNARELFDHPELIQAPVSAIKSMSADSKAYKGIAGSAHRLVEWLEKRGRIAPLRASVAIAPQQPSPLPTA